MDDKFKAILDAIVNGDKTIIADDMPPMSAMTIGEAQTFKLKFLACMLKAVEDLKKDFDHHLPLDHEAHKYPEGVSVKSALAVQIGIFLVSYTEFFISNGFTRQELMIGTLIGEQFLKQSKGK